MKKLKELRNEEGLSQKQLSEKIDVSTPSIAMYELGLRQPNIKTAKKIADYFNVSVDYIAFSEGEENKNNK